MGVREAFANIGTVVVVIWFVATVYILNTNKIETSEQRGTLMIMCFFAMFLFMLGMATIVIAVTS